MRKQKPEIITYSKQIKSIKFLVYPSFNIVYLSK